MRAHIDGVHRFKTPRIIGHIAAERFCDDDFRRVGAVVLFSEQAAKVSSVMFARPDSTSQQTVATIGLQMSKREMCTCVARAYSWHSAMLRA